MAFTVTHVMNTVMGNKRLRHLRVTADAAEANLTTGLSVVEFADIQPEVGSTMPAAQFNKNSTATASNGVVGVSGSSSGNIFHLIVYGR